MAPEIKFNRDHAFMFGCSMLYIGIVILGHKILGTETMLAVGALIVLGLTVMIVSQKG